MAKDTKIDTNTDRYPRLESVFSGILGHSEVPDSNIMHLEVHCQANGEATFRVWIRGEEEPRGGYLEGTG